MVVTDEQKAEIFLSIVSYTKGAWTPDECWSYSEWVIEHISSPKSPRLSVVEKD